METLDFTALENSVQRLKEVVEKYNENKQDNIVRDSLIQRFEFTYSISLKMLRKYFIERTFIVEDVNKLSFNDMVRTANQLGLLKSDLTKWTKFREMQNLTSHTYDEEVALKVTEVVPDFYEEAAYLLKNLKAQNKCKLLI